MIEQELQCTRCGYSIGMPMPNKVDVEGKPYAESEQEHRVNESIESLITANPEFDMQLCIAIRELGKYWLYENDVEDSINAILKELRKQGYEVQAEDFKILDCIKEVKR